MSSRGRNWIVTINGTHDLPEIQTEHVQYYVFGREKAPSTGMLHLQGYIELKNQLRMSSVKQIINCEHAHLELRRGSQNEAITYCKKEDQKPYEWGNPKQAKFDPKKSPQTKHEVIVNELDIVKKLIRDGATTDDFIEDHSAYWFKYKFFIKDYMDLQQRKAEQAKLDAWAEEVKLNKHQEKMVKMVNEQNDREITWIADAKGGMGKTWLSKYLLAKNKGQVARFTNAKTADIALAYNGEGLVIFDFSRTVDGKVNYGIIEALKNGMLFSGKYESRSKVFATPPKILCLANFMPDVNAMSKDRWKILDRMLIRGLEQGLIYPEDPHYKPPNNYQSDNDNDNDNDID